MVCKVCFKQVDDELDVCPVCGYKFTEEDSQVTREEPLEEVPLDEETSEEVTLEEVPLDEETPAEEEPSEEDDEECEGFAFTNLEEPRSTKSWKLVAGIVAAVIGLGALAMLLLVAMGVEIKLPKNDIWRKDCYSVSNEEAAKKGDVVVAKIGDATLTNAELEIYYRLQVQEFVSYYGSYLSYVNFDYTQPLSEQTSYFDETMTWEQYFIDVAIKTWQNYQALCLKAEAEGFVLEEELQTELAGIPESLEAQAIEGGHANADAYLKVLMGPACTMDDYMSYVQLNALGYEYYASKYALIKPTDEQIEAYFTEHEAEFNEQGITKESRASDVRHILVCPTGGTTDANGAVTYSEEEWAACLTKAESILQEWKDGEATEESFAALVATYSEDPGSVATDGLYEDITASSSYVENFLNWTIDTSRQEGDTGIVKTEYGYHIMYYVGGQTQWQAAATTQLMSEQADAIINDAKEQYPMKVTYRKIVLGELNLGA